MPMRKSAQVYFLVAILGECCALLDNRSARVHVIDRVVGGKTCEITDNPFIVTIHDYYYKHICGGTLLSSKWVLTAAHCCKRNLLYKEYTVYAGISTQTDLTGQSSIVLDNYIHPKFEMSTLQNDICLLQLEKAIEPSTAIGYVQLAEPYENGSNPELCPYGQVMGYGIQEILPITGERFTLKGYDPRLKCVTLKSSLDDIKCMVQSAVVYGGLKFCSISEEGGTDACKGDSGGPYMCDKLQFGIVSGGLGCGLRGFAGSYTNVYRFHDFIKKTIASGVDCLYSETQIIEIIFILIVLCHFCAIK